MLRRTADHGWWSATSCRQPGETPASWETTPAGRPRNRDSVHPAEKHRGKSGEVIEMGLAGFGGATVCGSPGSIRQPVAPPVPARGESTARQSSKPGPYEPLHSGDVKCTTARYVAARRDVIAVCRLRLMRLPTRGSRAVRCTARSDAGFRYEPYRREKRDDAVLSAASAAADGQPPPFEVNARPL